MTPLEANELRTLIQDVVRGELQSYQHKCRFDVSSGEAKEFGRFIGMISDMGEGRLGKGIDVIRQNHVWLSTQRMRGEKISIAFAVALATIMVGAMFSTIWLGVKAAMGR